MELTQNRNGLGAERNDVRLPSLHALGGNPPLRRFKIHFCPTRLAQLSWPNEGQRSKAQRGRDDGATTVAIHGPQQRTDRRGLGHSRQMVLRRCGERATQVLRRITFGAAGGDRVA